MTVVEGIDTSHWNVWPPIKPYGFVWIKATEGDTWIDPTFADRRNKVRSANKILGMYHFLTVSQDVNRQIAHFGDTAEPYEGDILALDFEWDTHWAGQANRFLASKATEAMNALDTMFPHNRTVLYCNKSTYATIVAPYSVPLNDGLWIASPGVEPRMPWAFWQYGSSPIDHDRAAFPDVPALTQWALEKGSQRNRNQAALINE